MFFFLIHALPKQPLLGIFFVMMSLHLPGALLYQMEPKLCTTTFSRSPRLDD